MKCVKRIVAMMMATIIMVTGIVYTGGNEKQVKAADVGSIIGSVDGWVCQVTSNSPKTAKMMSTSYGRYMSISSKIPSSIDGYTITEIADNAFDCTDKNQILFNSDVITIPDTVKKIGKAAFKNCTKIIGVSVGRGTETIGNDAFKGCDSLIAVALNGNSSIGSGAFNSTVKKVYYNPNISGITSKFTGTGISFNTIAANKKALVDKNGIYYVDLNNPTVATYMDSLEVNPMSYIISDSVNSYPVHNIGDGIFKDKYIGGSVKYGNILKTIGKESFKNTRMDYYRDHSNVYFRITGNIEKVEDRAFENFNGQSYMYVYGNPDFGEDVFKNSTIKKLYCYDFADNVMDYCNEHNMQYEIIYDESLKVSSECNRDGRMEVFTSGDDPRQKIKVSQNMNNKVNGFKIYFGGTAASNLEAKVSFDSVENGQKYANYTVKHPGKYYIKAVIDNQEVGDFYQLEFFKVMLVYPYNSISYALYEKNTSEKDIINNFKTTYTSSNLIYSNKVQGVYAKSDYSEHIIRNMSKYKTIYIAFELALNLGYSFCNSRYDFEYDYDYQIPLHSYEIIFGKTQLAKHIKESEDKYWVTNNSGHYETRYWGGNCSGMTSTASMLNNKNSALYITQFDNVYYSQILDKYTMNKVCNENVRTIIEAMQVGQHAFLDDRVYGPEKVREAVKSETMSNKKTTYISIGDHAVLAYYYDQSNDRIRVLDPNYPKDSTKYIQLSKTDKNYWHYDSMHGSDVDVPDEKKHNKKVSYIKYDEYNYIWQHRGTITLNGNYLNTNSNSFTVYNEKGAVKAKVVEGELVKSDKDVSLLQPNGECSRGIELLIEDKNIKIVNNDKDIDNFECGLCDVDNAANVTTQADEILFNVDDNKNINDVTIDTEKGDDYSIKLSSTDKRENKTVKLSGKGGHKDVSVSQHKGMVKKFNCPKAKYSITK